MKAIEDDTNRWKDVICSWIRRINILKMAILLQAIYRVNAILTNLPMAYSIELSKKIFYSGSLTSD